MFESILKNVREKTPFVHHITNYVTVNDCANMALACGGSPIMADDALEVEEITSICNALVINIGTLNERTIASMIKAGKKANELGHPVILDPVGAGASKLRTETANMLLQEVRFTVIRGNISEIKTVSMGFGTTKGVDADQTDQAGGSEAALTVAKELSKKTSAVVVITGAVDLITDGTNSYAVKNGHPLMSKITGTGCMLTSVIGAYCGANPDQPLEAAAAAVCAMGLCGEIGHRPGIGTSSYRTAIIDAMSLMDSKILNGGMKIERI